MHGLIIAVPVCAAATIKWQVQWSDGQHARAQRLAWDSQASAASSPCWASSSFLTGACWLWATYAPQLSEGFQ